MYAVPHNGERPPLTFRARAKSWICKVMQSRCYRCWRTDSTWPIRLPNDWSIKAFVLPAAAHLHEKWQSGWLFGSDHFGPGLDPSVKTGFGSLLGLYYQNTRGLFTMWDTVVTLGDTCEHRLTWLQTKCFSYRLIINKNDSYIFISIFSNSNTWN